MNLGKTLGKVFIVFNENDMRTGLELIDMFIQRYNQVLKKLGKVYKEMLYADLTFTLNQDENYSEKLLLIINEVIVEYNSSVKKLEEDAKLMKKEISHDLEILKGYISVIVDMLIGLINHEIDLDKFR